LAELNKATEDHLGISQGNLHFCPAKMLGSHVGCTLPCSDLHQLLIIVVEEVSVVGVIGQEGEHHDCYANGEDALVYVSVRSPKRCLVTDFNDVYPFPPSQTRHSVHLQDAICQQTTKSSSKSCTDEKVGHSLGHLLSLVDHCQI